MKTEEEKLLLDLREAQHELKAFHKIILKAEGGTNFFFSEALGFPLFDRLIRRLESSLRWLKEAKKRAEVLTADAAKQKGYRVSGEKVNKVDFYVRLHANIKKWISLCEMMEAKLRKEENVRTNLESYEANLPSLLNNLEQAIKSFRGNK